MAYGPHRRNLQSKKEAKAKIKNFAIVLCFKSQIKNYRTAYLTKDGGRPRVLEVRVADVVGQDAHASKEEGGDARTRASACPTLPAPKPTTRLHGCAGQVWRGVYTNTQRNSWEGHPSQLVPLPGGREPTGGLWGEPEYRTPRSLLAF